MAVPQMYYFQWDGIEDFKSYSFDEKGCPRVYYGEGVGFQYNPVTIAQYGLSRLNRFVQSGDVSSRQTALAMADWLVAHHEHNETGAAVWPYRFDLKFLGTRAPWISAMAQGEAISLLLRAYGISPNPLYGEVAIEAGLAFLHPIFHGGVCSEFPDGALALEEFPSEPPSHVLNGAIFALWGLYDLWLHTADREIEERYRQALAGLEANVHRYDTGYWTLYDLHPTRRLASPMYHGMHIQLVRILGKMTRNSEWESVEARWDAYRRSRRSRVRWAFGKVGEKLRLASR